MNSTATQTAPAQYDAGLRTFLIGVYNRLGLGLLVTGLLAWLAGQEPLRSALFTGGHDGKALGYTMLGYGVTFGPLLLLMFAGFTGKMASRAGSAIAYWGVTAMMGLSLGSLVIKYTGMSLATTFAITATGFGALSLWGYTTKKNLAGWGNFLLVALIGLIVASLVSVFMHSTVLELGINLIGILIFAGFIAYDTQTLKGYFALGLDAEELEVAQNNAALNLYLDFINLFILLLRWFGVLKSDD